jgi:hypothetical protein
MAKRLRASDRKMVLRTRQLLPGRARLVLLPPPPTTTTTTTTTTPHPHPPTTPPHPAMTTERSAQPCHRRHRVQHSPNTGDHTSPPFPSKIPSWHSVDNSGNTALHSATLNGHVAAMEVRRFRDRDWTRGNQTKRENRRGFQLKRQGMQIRWAPGLITLGPRLPTQRSRLRQQD